MFTRCWHIFLKTMKNVTVAKFELPFTRFETVRNLTKNNRCKTLMSKKYTSTVRICRVSFERRKMFCRHHFRVFTQCQFQNVRFRVPFSKSTVFKISWEKRRSSCEREIYSSHFLPISNMRSSCENFVSQMGDTQQQRSRAFIGLNFLILSKLFFEIIFQITN